MKNFIRLICCISMMTGSVNAQEMKLTIPPQGAGTNKYDMFGWQVAHGSDFVFAAAPFEDGQMPNSGGVYIYRKGVQQTFHQYLTLPPTFRHVRFGLSIAHSGQYFVATSQLPVQTPAGNGNIHLFSLGTDLKWTLVNSFRTDTTVSMMSPGNIALDGNTLLVSNPMKTNSYPNGCISVININPDNSISIAQRITVPGLNYYDLIGRKIAIHGDLLAFSSLSANGADKYSGNVWVYVKESGVWKFLSEIEQADGQSYDKFGSSLSVDYPSIIVGAMRQGTNTINGKKCGSVYVYRLSGKQLNLEAKLSADFAANHYDYFGTSVSIHKDILAVGSSGDDFGGTNTGAVYIFQRIGNSWQQVNKLIGSGVNDNALFGQNVAVYNGDVVCSAHLEENDSSKTDHGAVYFYRNAKLPLGTQPVVPSSGNANISFYPNPVADKATISLPAESEIRSVDVYDMKGSLIARADKTDFTSYGSFQTFAFDCNSWKKGMYVVSVKMNAGVQNFQIIKQ